MALRRKALAYNHQSANFGFIYYVYFSIGVAAIHLYRIVDFTLNIPLA